MYRFGPTINLFIVESFIRFPRLWFDSQIDIERKNIATTCLQIETGYFCHLILVLLVIGFLCGLLQ